jgi:hypothetical protein
MSYLTAITLVHTAISFIAIGAGAVAIVGLFRGGAFRDWTNVFLVTAVGMVASLYLLVFVGVVQAFQKIGFLNGLAPTQSELPFLIAQGTTLALFVVIGIVAARSYRPEIAAARFPSMG